MKPESPVTFTPETAADAWMGLLAMRGVDYLFANGGTDFAPVVEAFAKGEKLGWRLPEIVIVPHENMGVAMAHGYAMVTGKPQAMMVHVGVGTANTINGLINASRTNIPILLTAGRTPITEGHGAASGGGGALVGARNNYIHWAQEHFDQGGMLREFVKWDYELRHPEQVETVLDRALAICKSEPQGPVYSERNKFEHMGEMRDNEDFYFVAQCAAEAPRMQGVTADEIALMQEIRWWTAEEVEAAIGRAEKVFPVDLATRMREFAGFGTSRADGVR